METPPGVAPEVGGIDFDPRGRLVACFRRGGLYRRDPDSGRWSRFATGLQVPLGIVAGKPGEYFVAQLSELTRIVDTDGDERADHYQTLSDQWGMSGNYHEFVYGLARDGKGNFYMGLGLRLGFDPSPVLRAGDQRRLGAGSPKTPSPERWVGSGTIHPCPTEAG